MNPAEKKHLDLHIDAIVRDMYDYVENNPDWHKTAQNGSKELTDDFWNSQLKDRQDAVVIDGVHYRIGDTPYPERGNGFGGNKYVIHYLNSDKVVKTRDLWHQGTVPQEYRQVLPDSAEFVVEED